MSVCNDISSFHFQKEKINFTKRAMSVGEFEVAGYKFRLTPTMFTIRKEGTPSFTLRIGVLNFGNIHVEDLEWEVHSPLHATIETDRQFMRLIYYEPNFNSDGNGQIEVSVKSDVPGDIPSWSTLMNGIPREVIVAGIAILNGDDDVEQYRIRRNNEGQVVVNAEDPNFSNENVPVPRGNNNGNNPSGNNQGGGKRRKRRVTRGRRT